MVAELNLTPTERKLMDVLSDGMPHRADLAACINDELGCSLQMHLSNLRAKIREHGLNVVSVRGEWMLMQRIQPPTE